MPNVKSLKQLTDLTHGIVVWKYDITKKDKISRSGKKYKSIIHQEKYILNYHQNNPKQPNLFEITYDDKYIKMCFDIDECEIDKSQLTTLLKEFHTELITYLNEPLDIKNMLVYIKKEDTNYTDKIHSIHIIYKETRIEYDTMELLCKLMRDSNMNELTENIDNSKISHKDRQFCIPYNSKPHSKKILEIGYENELQSNDRIFIDYNIHKTDTTKKQTKKPRNYLISYVSTDYQLYTIKQEHITEEIKEQLKKDKQSFNYSDTKNNYGDREKICLRDSEDVIDTILCNVSIDFYEPKYCRDWKVVCCNLKKLRINNIDDFIDYSLEICDNNGKWTKQKSLEYYNSIETDKLKYNPFSMICKTINKHQSKYYFHNDYLTINKEEISQFIKDKCNVDCIDLLNTYDLCDIENPIITITDDIEYNLDTGFLKHNDMIYNYNLEIDYPKHYKDNSKSIIENNEVCICETENDDFVNESIELIKQRELDVFFVCAKWNTGKSYKVVKPIITHRIETHYNKYIDEDDYDLHTYENEEMIQIQKHIDMRLRIVCLTESNSLNSQVYSDYLKIPNHNFYNHLELQDSKYQYNKCDLEMWINKNQIINKCSMITSLESCDKVVKLYDDNKEEDTYIDILIIDELESVLNHFESSKTFKSKCKNQDGTYINLTAFTQYQHFKNIIKHSKQIIGLDADLTEERMKWIVDIKNGTII